MRSIYLLSLLSLCFTACQSDTDQLPPVEEQLIQQLGKQSAIQDYLTNFPYAYVSREYYCQTEDCQEIFSAIGLDIPVYAREEAFMRALRHAIIIREINTSETTPYLRYELRTNNKVSETGTITL